MRKIISLREYSKIADGISGLVEAGTTEVDSETFNQLSEHIEENQDSPSVESAFSQFRRNRRRYIQVKNYVGLVQTKNGTIFEIVPKIHRPMNESDTSLSEAKSVVIKMLASLKNSPFISLGEAGIDSNKDMPLLEIFISAFIGELELLLRKELRGGYQVQREETQFIKGKVLIEEQLRLFNPARVMFICEYDIFSIDVSPNRLIKSVLIKLGQITSDPSNANRIRKHLENFEGISESKDIRNDFSYCRQHGFLLKNYEKLLSWCEVILENKGFSGYHGNSVNLSILFPMEKLFESYIAHLLTKYAKGLEIKTQDRRFHLVEELRAGKRVGQFQLRPDLVLQKNKVIIDTKWKILEDSKSHFNISEKDMYQMFAYGKRYQSEIESGIAPKLFLVYPSNVLKNEDLPKYIFGNEMSLDIVTFDLLAENQFLETQRLISVISA
jgi:5-methylcytosine-specific restriction enzyme subunit McrC